MENNIPDKVYEQLKDEILFLKLKPGEIISEIETSKRFNVSRTPVRDAFKRLEAEGYIFVKPHIGTFVSLIDLDKITDTIFMREMIELGIMFDIMDNLTEQTSIKLEMSLVKQKSLLDSDDEDISAKFIRLDNEFHQLMYVLDNHQGVSVLLKNVEQHYQRFRTFIDISNKERIKELYNDHVRIVKDIKSHDYDDLKEMYVKHLYSGVQHSTPLIIEHKEYFENIENI